jgi:hypothetical protein
VGRVEEVEGAVGERLRVGCVGKCRGNVCLGDGKQKEDAEHGMG